MSTKWWLVIRWSDAHVLVTGVEYNNRWRAVATFDADEALALAASQDMENQFFASVNDDEDRLWFETEIQYPLLSATVINDKDLSQAERLRYRADIKSEAGYADAAAAVIKRLTGANKRVIFSGKMPSPDVVDLCHKLAEADGKSDRAIARDFTRGDAKKADSLLTRIRTLKRERRVLFE